MTDGIKKIYFCLPVLDGVIQMIINQKRIIFYTKDEAIAFKKSSKYAPDKDFDWNDEDAVMEMLHENEWYDYDYYWNEYCEYYETFEDTTTMPSGEKVVAFGYYGHD